MALRFELRVLDLAQLVLGWLVALAIDYLGPIVIGIGRGWHLAPAHFAERHGLIILIALGESIIDTPTSRPDRSPWQTRACRKATPDDALAR